MGGVRPEGKKGKKTTTTRRGRGWGERQETEIMLLNCRIRCPHFWGISDNGNKEENEIHVKT